MIEGSESNEKRRRLGVVAGMAAAVVAAMLFLLTVLHFSYREWQLRQDIGMQYAVELRRIHCLDNGYIFLCPNRQANFHSPITGRWSFRSNRFGERVTPTTLPETSVPRNAATVWVAGDSVAMGYLLDDEESPPWLLAVQSGAHVRNLGVDSLGAAGIHRRIEHAFGQHLNESPDLVIWIFNASDYIDDIRDKHLLSSPLRVALFHAHFAVASNLYLYAATRHRPDQPVVMPMPAKDEPPPQIDSNHPTLRWISRSGRMLAERGVRRVALFHPGMGHDGKPDIGNPWMERAKEEFARSGYEILDLSEEFAAATANELYFAGDGHPTPYASAILARAMADLLYK